MGRLLASVYDYAMRGVERAHFAAWRGELLAQARGDVAEIGAGTGANLTHYSDAVDRLVLMEPDPHMRRKLATHPQLGRRHEVVAATAERLPLADASMDSVVSTLVLCSVTDLDAALHEAHRVLRPGGTFLFMEHVAARDDPSVQRWQKRITPLWRRAFGNCHLARASGEAIRTAGFEVESMHYDRLGGPSITSPVIHGVAIKAAAGGRPSVPPAQP